MEEKKLQNSHATTVPLSAENKFLICRTNSITVPTVTPVRPTCKKILPFLYYIEKIAVFLTTHFDLCVLSGYC